MGIIYHCDYLECHEITKDTSDWFAFYSHNPAERYFYLCPTHAKLFDVQDRNRKMERKLNIDARD